MKKLLFAGLSIILLGIFVFMSCQREMDDDSTDRAEEDGFSVAEARAAFETAITRAAAPDRELPMGELTPNWEKAIASQDTRTESVDVPIATRYSYMAIRKEWIDGRNRSYFAPITMRLVVLRNLATGKMKAYRQGIVPDFEYMRKHPGDLSGAFGSNGPKDDFSGTLFYFHLFGEIPLKAFIYKNGKLIDAIELRANTLDEYVRQFKMLVEMYRGLKITRQVNVATRSGTEYPDFEYNEDQLNEIGNGFWWYEYSNGDTQIVQDTDGDGAPDSNWLPPADATGPGNNNDDNWPPDWGDDDPENEGGETDDPDDGGGGGGGTSTAPIAKKILKGNLTADQWKDVEEMIKKIREDCMGNALYNSLVDKMDGATWQLTYDPSESTAMFDGSTVTVNDLKDPYPFMHELFHGYQAYGESITSFNNATANLEVEAQLAKIKFMLNESAPAEFMKNYELVKNGDIVSRGALALNNMLTPNGQLGNPSNTDLFYDRFYEFGQAYVKTNPTLYRWDNGRRGDQNMKNIINLSTDC